MSANNNWRSVKRGHDFTQFQAVLRQKCQLRMRQQRDQLFNRNRLFRVPAEGAMEALTEIVRQEFKKLATSDTDAAKSLIIIDGPLSQDEAIEEENKMIAEQEQWLIEEYEKLLAHDMLWLDEEHHELFCPLCQKHYLEQIPGFIKCDLCGMKLRSDIKLNKFKSDLEMFTNLHSENCKAVPNFSLSFDNNNIGIRLSCSICFCDYLIKTVES